MMGSQKKKSASEKFLDLINPAPVHFDPEDDNDEDTTAKVVDKYDEDSTDEDNELSKFKANIELLDDQDTRYAGKKVSRKGLNKDAETLPSKESSDEASPFSTNEERDNENDMTISGSENENLAESNSDGEDGGEEEEEEDDGDDDDDSDSYSINKSFASVELNGKGKSEEEGSNFQHMSKQNIKGDIEKGTAVRNQLSMWDNLLECRIQLQKCLLSSNKLPQYATFEEFKSHGGEEFATLVEQTKKSSTKLLDKMMKLRETMLVSFSETKNMGQLKRKNVMTGADTEVDEEIPSDSDLEADTESNKQVDSKVQFKSKRRRIDDFEKLLDSQHNDYREYRNETIQKWNDKTRVASGNVSSRNFSTFEQTTLKQIEQILSNRQRLIQRTQLKRSVFSVLGQNSPIVEEQEVLAEDESVRNREDKSKEYDPEIFDDSDFYHQLLRELIERKTLNVTDPTQLGRQWIEIQKLRSKMKKKVDTKATKGRKIRYVVHPKLVNFMAPISDSSVSEAAKSELYNSLFGKKSLHS